MKRETYTRNIDNPKPQHIWGWHVDEGNGGWSANDGDDEDEGRWGADSGQKDH